MGRTCRAVNKRERPRPAAQLEQMQARIDYDLEYLRHWSLFLDLKILARTVLRLVRDANNTAV